MSPAAARARARRGAPRRWPKVKPNPGLDRLSADLELRLKIEDLITDLLGPAVDDARCKLSSAVEKLKEACEGTEGHDDAACKRCAVEGEIDYSAIDLDVDPGPVAESIVELLRAEKR
jgi:hypothetical protein